MQDLVNIAKISGTHHLKGILKASSVLEQCNLVIGQSVILELVNGVQKLYSVRNCERINNKMILIDLEGINSINEAIKLKLKNYQVDYDIIFAEYVIEYA